MFFVRSFTEYLINKAARMFSKPDRKSYFGKKLFVHIKSKNSPNLSRSEIFKKFILKSPTIAVYVFLL